MTASPTHSDSAPSPGSEKERARRPCPFVGLRPFNFVDKHHFYGRDDQIDAVEEKIAASRLLTVIGSSGSGKSSLIRAGLLPRLVESPTYGTGSGWCRAEMRPGEAPIRQLAEALAELDREVEMSSNDPMTVARADRIELALRDSSFGIREALPLLKGLGDKTLIILVDQFEEVFRFASLRAQQGGDPVRSSVLRDDATFFVQLLLTAAADDEFPGRIILTMRSDFIGDCARFHGLSEAVTNSQYLVPALTRDQRAAAIRRPVEVAGGSIEPALIQQLLNDTNEDPDQLPVLQHAMMRCWQQAVAEADYDDDPPRLTRAQYAKVGGVARALSLHADLVLQELVTDDRGVARSDPTFDLVTKRLFQSLTDTDSQGRTIRRPQKFGDLVSVMVADSAGSAAKAAVIAKVRHAVLKFADPGCGFLRGVETGDLSDTWVVDIGHEALIRRWDRLGSQEGTNWVREELEDGEKFRDLLRLARMSGVIPPAELPKFEKWWKDRGPTPTWAKRYVKDGAEGIEAAEGVLVRSRAAKRHRILWWLAIASAVVVAGLVELNAERERDEAQARYAREQSLAGARLISTFGGEALHRDGAESALLMAMYGLDEKNQPYIPEMEGLAYQALQQLRSRRILSINQPVTSVGFAADGSLVAIVNMKSLRFWDPLTGKTSHDEIVLGKRAGQMVVSPDGTLFLTGGPDGGLLTSLADRTSIVIGGGDPTKRINSGAFSPDGKRILTFASGDISPKLWDIAHLDDPIFDFGNAKPSLSKATAVAFSRAAPILAIGGPSGDLHLYNAETRDLIMDLPDCLSQIRTASDTAGQQINSLAFHPKDPNILVVAHQGAACWIDIDIPNAKATVNPLPMQADSEEKVRSVMVNFLRAAFTADGARIVVTSSDGVVRMWYRWREPRTYSLSLLLGSQGSVSSLAIRSLDGNAADEKALDREMMASVSPSEQKIRLWNIYSALSQGLVFDKAHAPEVIPAPESGRAEARGRGITLRWVEAEGSYVLDSNIDGIPSGPLLLPRGKRQIRAAAFSADGSWLVLAPPLGRLFLFDLKRFNGPIVTLGGVGAQWDGVGFREDPDRVVGVLTDGNVREWRYFRDLDALLSFGAGRLPILDGEPVRLDAAELCKLKGQSDIIPVDSKGQEAGEGCQ